MLKRVIIFILSSLLLVSIANAAVSLTYRINPNNVSFDIYNCSNNCNSVNLISNNNIQDSLTYAFPEEGSYLYVVYKECFYPLSNEVPVVQDIDGAIVDLNLNKKSSCNANIGRAINFEGGNSVGNNIIVSANVESPFLMNDYFRNSFLNNLSRDKEEFFKSDINVKMYVDNVLIHDINYTLFIGETKKLDFNWIPQSSGEHEIKFLTSVLDCQCSNLETFEKKLKYNIVGITNVATNNVPNTPFAAGCGEGDGCNPKCLEGDKDCSCEVQNGFICEDNQVCSVDQLKNWGNKYCCPIACKRDSLLSDTKIAKFLSRGDKENNTNSSNYYSKEEVILDKGEKSLHLLVTVGLICIILGIFISKFGIETYFKSFFYFIGNTIKKILVSIFDFISLLSTKIANFLRVKRKDENVKVSSLFNKIGKNLTNDENKVLYVILENEGIKKSDLIDRLGFTKDRLEYSLLKLKRMQIIIFQGDEDNPNIYLDKWVK
ncbi:hypothetical protein J4216_05605 [Candidatus Woesearchaeota archaeon]|nr:hypothetical protein [Candidatus Woesearchaeota archaeon]